MLGGRLPFLYRMVPFALVSLIVCGWCGSAHALDPRKEITQYVRDIWRDELPQASILALTQTRDGYLWIGTYEGLARFDGIRFEVFSKTSLKGLKSNGVFAVCEDRGNRLWLATAGGGLACLEGEKLTVYTTAQGLPSNTVRAVCEDRDGRIWAGTEQGLCLVENDRMTTYTTKDGLPHNVIRALHADPSGILWVGTLGGLGRFDGGGFTSYTTANGLKSNQIATLASDRAGALWIGTEGGGLSRFRNGALTTYTKDDGLSGNVVLAILEDRHGNLWIGTDGDGLNRLTDGVFSAYTIKDGLAQSTARSLYEDREGSLWIGTSSGLNRLRDGKFLTYTTQNGLSDNYLRSIIEDRTGTVWMTSEGGGVTCLKDGKAVTYTVKNGMPSNLARTLCEDRDGNVWVGTNAGLCRFTNGKITVFKEKDGLSNDNLYALYQDRAGTLWIGTGFGGVNAYRDGKFTAYTTKDGLSNNGVRAIFEDRQGNLWLGTNNGLTAFKDGKFTVFTTNDGLSNDRVFAFYEDAEGAIWMGTNGGLNRYKDGGFLAYTTEDGMFDDVAFRIVEDDLGRLWMGCNRGLYRIDRKSFAEFDRGEIKRLTCVAYGKSDGMLTNQCNGGSQPAGWKAKDGRLWFPTVKGAIVVDPNNIVVNTLPPPAVLEEITADGEPIRHMPSHIVEPGRRKLEFHYTGLSLVSPERVTFKFRLDGFDKEWVHVGTRRTAYYTNIPPGNYTFRVMACNNDGVWSEREAVFHFRLKPPLWQTWWAYCLYVLTGSGAIYGGVQLRLRTLRERTRLLEAKVAERTVELEDAVQRLRQSQEETERKNKQLSEAKIEVERKNRLLDSKVAELARKNEDLIASQKQADRIFSALAEALPGTVLDEKYRLDEKIGAGGFGAVFRATHLSLNRPIAIKVFRPSAGNDSPDAIERFRREGISACRVNHPNAITVLDSNISADGIAYIVMELLEGHTLTQEIRNRGRLPLKRSAAIIIPVCRALAEAHALGIVHRDIKPDNIFLHRTKEGEVVKVVDFGIAKLIGDSLEAQDQDLTSTGGIVGTPVYMSPERLSGDDYDGRADVYSVGVTLYEMLSGRVPFQPTSKGLVEVILRHIKETPQSLRSLNPSIPPEVEEVVKKALAKKPENRPSAREFADEFARIAAELAEIELERSMVPGAGLASITEELNVFEPRTEEQKLAEAETAHFASPSDEMPTLINVSIEVKE